MRRYTKQIPIRFSEAMIRQLDRFIRDYPGTADSRAMAVRVLVQTGLEKTERKESKKERKTVNG